LLGKESNIAIAARAILKWVARLSSGEGRADFAGRPGAELRICRREIHVTDFGRFDGVSGLG